MRIIKKMVLLIVGIGVVVLNSCDTNLVNDEVADKDSSVSRSVYYTKYKRVDSFKSGDFIYLRCEGTLDGFRWLNGLTANNDVNLASYRGDNNTGTKWLVIDGPDEGTFVFQTQGNIPGNTYLDGYTPISDVGLAPYFGGYYSGTVWKAITLPDGQFAFYCMGDKAGDRYLNGGTPNGIVGLAPYYGGYYSGAVWSIWVEK